MMNWSQYIIVTCPSSSAGTQISAQQANRNAGLLDGSRLLEAQSCDGLQGHNRRLETTTTEPGPLLEPCLEGGPTGVHLLARSSGSVQISNIATSECGPTSCKCRNRCQVCCQSSGRERWRNVTSLVGKEPEIMREVGLKGTMD